MDIIQVKQVSTLLKIPQNIDGDSEMRLIRIRHLTILRKVISIE